MGVYSGIGGKPKHRFVWDGRIASFHALTRYWITSARAIKANAALGIKYNSERKTWMQVRAAEICTLGQIMP